MQNARRKLHVKVLSSPVALIPLVDVFFLMLVFFMISNSLVFWPGTKVETKVRLPRSRVNSMSIADKIVITITQSGLLFFNDKNVGWDDLERELRKLVHRSEEESARRANQTEGETVERARSPLVVLRADRDIPYQRIVDVMTLARSLDLGVYLVTDSQAGSAEEPPVLGEE